MRIVEFAISRPVSVFIFSVAAVVFGLVAFRNLAVDLLPDITYPSLTVRTEYEGTAPAEVETLLTRPVEDAVGVVNNVVKVTSSSRADVSEVTLEFNWGVNMDLAALDVRERLDIVRLPVAVEKPVLLRYDPSLDPILRIGLYGSDDLGRLRFTAEETVKRALERIEGVAAVLVSGGLEEEIQVEIDERRLSNLGLSLAQVATRLAAENVNLTGGRLREGQTEFLVRTINEYKRPEDIRAIVVDSSRGASIRVGDLARVFTGYKEREIITRINGQESVEVAVYKEGGTNTVTVSDAVLSHLDSLRKDLKRVDPRLDVSVVTDQAQYIRQSVREVLETAFYGGLLAIGVLLFFLRSVKKTLIISVSIPVSVVATFFLMYLCGVSLNIMSLGGLTLGVGLLVDNAIVVLEAIQRKREDGLDEVEAARVGASEVGQAVTASTLTTVCVFVPIVFVEGISAQLFRDQALTVAFSLVVSLVVALTLIPMLASREIRWQGADEGEGEGEREAGDGERRRSRFFLTRWVGAAVFLVTTTLLRAVVIGGAALARFLALLSRPALALFTRSLEATGRVYDGSLAAVLRHPVMTLGVTVALFAGSLGLYRRLGSELVPELVQGEFFVDVELPPGTRLEVTSKRMAALESFARQLEGARTVYAVSGTSHEQGGVSGELRENIGQLTVTLAPPVSRELEDHLMEEIRSRLDRDNRVLRETALSGSEERRSRANVIDYSFGRPSYFSFKTPIEVEIRGHNLTLLERLAAEVVARMRSIEGLADVKSSTEGGAPRAPGAVPPRAPRGVRLQPRRRGAAHPDEGAGGDRHGHHPLRPHHRHPAALPGAVPRQRARPGEPQHQPERHDPDPALGGGGRRAAGGPRRDPPGGWQSGGADQRQPGGPRPRVGVAGHHREPRGDGLARALRLAPRRSGAGDGDLLREHAPRHPARGLHGLPGDGQPVRESAPPLRHPLQRPLRGDRRPGDDVPLRGDGERRFPHRLHPPRRHRRQRRHRARGLHEPAAPRRHGQGRGPPARGARPAAADPHDHGHHGPRPPAHGPRPRRGGGAPHPHGPHGHRRHGHLHPLDAPRRAGGLRAPRLAAVGGRGLGERPSRGGPTLTFPELRLGGELPRGEPLVLMARRAPGDLAVPNDLAHRVFSGSSTRVPAPRRSVTLWSAV
ncbi:MAG: efflux RND transporter permease subunit [Planctomycetota bacterium]|nr:efflux RND transporter permease subunit [Planctomycetota bacterium]